MADIGGFFKHTLPGMAAAVASGIPGPIGAVAQIISAVLNKDVKPEAGAISAAIAGATPEQVIKLKEDDQNFQATMQKMGFDHVEDLEKIAADDRRDARGMEVQTKSRIPAVLAFVLTVGFLVLLSGMMLGKLKVSDNQALMLLLGSLATSFGAVIQYYFGSSAGSDRKTELLAGK